MKSKQGARSAALVAALLTFVVLAFGLKLRNFVPFVAAGTIYLGALLALWPRRAAPARLPDGVERTEYNLALERLADCAARLRMQAGLVEGNDASLFDRMAELLDQIAQHHRANPLHVNRTRTFIRSTLRRIVEAVSDYVALARRAGPDQASRMGQISAGLAAFIPVLERIDQACIDNDLTALEINVEVLNDQLDRER